MSICRFVFSALSFTMVAFVSAAASAIVVLDQENSPPPFSVIVGSGLQSFNQIAQTFAVGHTGVLDSIDLSLGVNESASGDVIFSLLPTIGGVPQIATPIYEQVFAANTLQDFSLSEPFSLNVDVSSAGLFVKPGDEYAWALSHSGAGSSNVFVNAAGSYDGGDPFRRSSDVALWSLASGSDRLFRTYVDTDATSGSSLIQPSLVANVDLDTDLGEYVVEPDPFTLVTNQRLAFGVDDRAIIEFPLSSIPANTVLTSARLNLDVNLFTTGGDDFADVPMFGYEGDGFTSANDAAVTADFLGSTGPVMMSGPLSVDLDKEFIEGLVVAGSTLGIAMIGSANSFQTGFDNFTNPPTLTLEYDFLLPGDFNRDGVVDAADFTVWRDSEGQTGPGLAADANGDQEVDALDYAAWVENFGQTTQNVASIPEPGAAMLMALAMAGFYSRCRGGVREHVST